MDLCEDSDLYSEIEFPFCLVSTKICVKELARVYGSSSQHVHPEALKADMVEESIEPLRKREKRLRMTWRNHTGHKEVRAAMVHYICNVCLRFQLSRATAALAAHIFNYFQDSHTIVLHQIHTVALTCLYIAAKIHQRDILVRMKYMSRTIPAKMSYSVKLFVEVERMVLAYFQHEVLIPTVNDFIETYCAVAVEDVDVFYKLLAYQVHGVTSEDGNTLLAVAKDDKLLAATLRRDTRLLASEMTNVMSLLLDEEPSNKFPPSLIAAAILLLIRLKYQFQRWCGFLERLTGYPHEDVVVCINEYVLANEDVRDFLELSESVMITSDMLESDEFVIESIFEAEVYPLFVLIGGAIVRKPEIKKFYPELSCSSSSSGYGGIEDTSGSSSFSVYSLNDCINPMSIPSSSS